MSVSSVGGDRPGCRLYGRRLRTQRNQLLAGEPDSTVSTLLIRHGETRWNAAGRIQGWAPVPLSDRGHEQAAQVGAVLAADEDVDRIVSSDLRRTRETATAIAEAVGVDVETDPRLRERDFGVFQGVSSATFFERHPSFDLLEAGTDALSTAPESGESWLAVRERVRAAAADVADRPGTTAVVTHVNPIRLLVGERRGLDPIRSLTELSFENCSVSEITADDVVREDDVPWA